MNHNAYIDVQLLTHLEQIRPIFTNAEDLLWNILEVEPFSSLKFRRQHVIAPYVVNFYCAELRLVIELDTGTYTALNSPGKDLQKNTFFNHLGLRVLRYRSDDILNHPEVILRGLANVCNELKTTKQ